MWKLQVLYVLWNGMRAHNRECDTIWKVNHIKWDIKAENEWLEWAGEERKHPRILIGGIMMCFKNLPKASVAES